MNVLGKKTEKCKTFSVPIKKPRKVNKDGNEDIITISYKIKFIDSERFMSSSLSSLFDNLTQAISTIKCEDYDRFLEYKNVKDNSIKYKCLSFKRRLIKQDW